MKNEYGLDDHYFAKKLGLVLRDVKHYTPDEMFRELTALAEVAKRQAAEQREFLYRIKPSARK
ncbi:hypothetical protein tloyanaT_13160 [Thalassotalea loyana]|uniref:Uncharacterized protein n=1 Tax=Thalassotalea loyana TaxID=280483 RepID=A0ABQ6HAQ7_9GAMM|nr:hypothetical protein [Thalassotalea loyana]GLX85064.1 hypothetical protein tloyanaT_13160 [Thalassotalea loyana]